MKSQIINSSCDLTRDKSNYWVPQMYIHKQSDGKFHHVENYFAVYYKLLNGRGQTSLHNNNYEPGYFHSFPPGFRYKGQMRMRRYSRDSP